ncbi:DEAD/DEAH box helicase family protein [Streptomyces sp. NBC_01643]|uniref:DEAD/DEAH box helicase family protein n=1 Tax=Streptomyces sp. NBC_01643 TaxID=2975906 RepID=UPI00386856C6|nr:DEAD/DEAH box helicase family protein [Streptomyces sp. NBC_01643]WTD38866.1 DEAD/DEAH box helicase family protein [Streptomyces sp. NBC_01643]
MATLTSNGLRTQLWGHQELACDACVTNFAAGAPRVTVIMATGTGKTFVGLNIAQETAPHGSALVVMPSLDLLEQTAAVWRREGRQGVYLGYCSRDYPQDRSLTGILTMVDDPGELARYAALSGGAVNVFCTYQSLNNLAKAHRYFHLPPWDILIADFTNRRWGVWDVRVEWSVGVGEGCGLGAGGFRRRGGPGSGGGGAGWTVGWLWASCGCRRSCVGTGGSVTRSWTRTAR